jgi:aminoglycoside 2''-phosphotransferase
MGRRIGGWQRPNARRQPWLETRSPVPIFPTDPDDCLRFLRAAQPALEIHRHVVVTEGWDSIVLLVNGNRVYRFARRPDVVVRFTVEAALLPELAPALPAPVPRFDIVRLGEPDAPFVAYALLLGEQLSPGWLAAASPEQRGRLAEQLGGCLGALHRFPPTRAAALGVPAYTAATWHAEYVEFFAWVREHVFPLLDHAERRQVAAFWETFLGDDTNVLFSPVLIHRDLGNEHVLHDPATGALTGVIDWGDVSIGDPAQDFVGFYHSLGRPFAEKVLASYTLPVDDTFWRRVAFYAGLDPFHTMRFGIIDGQQALVAEGLAALRAQLATG